MRIAISGLSGCGNTTACANVSQALNLKKINYTMRDISNETKIPLTEIQLLAEKYDAIDCALDYKLLQLAQREQNCVIGTRLAGWLINADLTVWLHASLATRAKRVGKREEKPLSRLMKETRLRDKQNILRYKHIYNINTLNHDNFDLVVNTERLSPDQVAALIVAAAKLAEKNWQRVKNPFPEQIKRIIDRNLSEGNLLKVKDKQVEQVIKTCLQFK